MSGKNLKIWGLAWFLLASLPCLWGANDRTAPIDVYVIVDGSAAMEKGKAAAAEWLCATVIDGMLLEADRIWIWTAGAKPELVYSGTLTNKEEAKAAIRSIRCEGNAANYRSVLREAKNTAAQSNRTSYTLLVSGSGAKDAPNREAESAGLLRYSRVESFSGWRVLTVGLDLEPKVKAASAYYRNRR